MEILIAGDYCPRYRVQDKLEQNDFPSVLGEVKVILSQVDYSILNFECPVVKRSILPIKKWGPNLKTNSAGIECVKWTGFDCVTLANNHFYDFGDEGVRETINACNDLEIDYVGGGHNFNEASQPLYKEINSEVVAIINCCENEFSIADINHGGSNPLNPIRQYYAIKEAKEKAQYVIVIVHGGHEFFQYPSLRMVETYRFFIDAGADIVVNHHQHCFSGYEIYKGKPIYYGLGNFCFDWHPICINSNWNYGYMVIFSLSKNEISSRIIPYKQCSEHATVEILPSDYFDKDLHTINTVIQSEKMLQETVNTFYNDTSYYWAHSILEPFNNKYYMAAAKRKIVPSLISEKRSLRAEDYICCEAHRDKLIYCLKNKM